MVFILLLILWYLVLFTGPNAKLSDVFGGAEDMDVDENAYKPDEGELLAVILSKS